jgi:hypothetical protein
VIADLGVAGDLARIVAAWPTLPEPIRRVMLSLIGVDADGLDNTVPSRFLTGITQSRRFPG